MFKIFTVFSLLTLLADGGSAQHSSPWGAVIAFFVVITIVLLVVLWVRSRYRLVRKMIYEKLRKPNLSRPVIKPDVWKKIESGEMAKNMINKEKH